MRDRQSAHHAEAPPSARSDRTDLRFLHSSDNVTHEERDEDNQEHRAVTHHSPASTVRSFRASVRQPGVKISVAKAAAIQAKIDRARRRGGAAHGWTR